MKGLEGRRIVCVRFEGLSDDRVPLVQAAVRRIERSVFSLSRWQEIYRFLQGQPVFQGVRIGIVEAPKSPRSADDKCFGDGIVVQLVFSERQSIKGIEVEGNKIISSASIKGAMLLKEGSPFRGDSLAQDILSISRLYHNEGVVGTRVSIRSEDIVGGVSVRVLVTEGTTVYVEDIEILGVKEPLDEGEILSSMQTAERSFYSTDAILDRSILDLDKGRIRDYCASQGFIDADITSIDVELRMLSDDVDFDPASVYRGYRIRVALDQGQQYRFRGLEIQGSIVFEKEALLEKPAFPFERGDIFDEGAFKLWVKDVEARYQNQGYMNVQVIAIPERDRDKREVFYRINIQEGRLVYIENIYLEGNESTQPWVVDRELMIKEGMPLSFSRVRGSLQRIFQTSYFEFVEPRITAGSAQGLANVTLQLREAQTGNVQAGLGFGTIQGFSAHGQITDKNSFGFGVSSSLRFEIGTRSLSLRLALSTPYLFPYIPISASIFAGFSRNIYTFKPNRIVKPYFSVKDGGIFNSDLNNDGVSDINDLVDIDGDGYIDSNDTFKMPIPWKGDLLDFTAYNFSAGFTLGYRFWSQLLAYGGYSIAVYNSVDLRSEDVSYTDTQVGTLLDKGFLRSELLSGLEFQHTISAGLNWDRRDRAVNTTRGWQMRQVFDFTGGIIGGGSNWIKSTSEVKGFLAFPWYWLEDYKWTSPLFVIAAKASVEAIFPQFGSGNIMPSDIRIADMVTFNSMSELRGWKASSLSYQVYSSTLTGLGKVFASTEIRVPVPFLDRFLWAIFFIDAGNLMSDPRGGLSTLPLFSGAGWLSTPVYDLETGVTHGSQTTNYNGLRVDQGFKFSYGFGVSIQIPFFPIQIFWGHPGRMISQDGKLLRPWPYFDDGLSFVFSVQGVF